MLKSLDFTEKRDQKRLKTQIESSRWIVKTHIKVKHRRVNAHGIWPVIWKSGAMMSQLTSVISHTQPRHRLAPQKWIKKCQICIRELKRIRIDCKSAAFRPFGAKKGGSQKKPKPKQIMNSSTHAVHKKSMHMSYQRLKPTAVAGNWRVNHTFVASNKSKEEARIRRQETNLSPQINSINDTVHEYATVRVIKRHQL